MSWWLASSDLWFGFPIFEIEIHARGNERKCTWVDDVTSSVGRTPRDRWRKRSFHSADEWRLIFRTVLSVLPVRRQINYTLRAATVARLGCLSWTDPVVVASARPPGVIRLPGSDERRARANRPWTNGDAPGFGRGRCLRLDRRGRAEPRRRPASRHGLVDDASTDRRHRLTFWILMSWTTDAYLQTGWQWRHSDVLLIIQKQLADPTQSLVLLQRCCCCLILP